MGQIRTCLLALAEPDFREALLKFCDLGVGDVGLARVAPEREVQERKGDFMLLLLIMLNHVLVDEPRAEYARAFETHPILAGVLASLAFDREEIIPF